jgi:FkbM family methyltransferase
MRSLTTYVMLEQEQWFEPEMSLLPLLLTPGMNCLDIGANHGIYTLEMARCTGTGQVIAFEPTQVPRSRLLQSVAEADLGRRITVVDAGLADTDGTASFAVQDNSELNSREGAGAQRETVRLLALDSYLASIGRGQATISVGFVKLDAEGDEVRVLAGARQFFAAQSPVVLFEYKHGCAVNTAIAAFQRGHCRSRLCTEPGGGAPGAAADIGHAGFAGDRSGVGNCRALHTNRRHGRGAARLVRLAAPA